MRKKYTICVSPEAYAEIKRRAAADPKMYSARGGVGVVDQLLFGRFTGDGRGNPLKYKKTID